MLVNLDDSTDVNKELLFFDLRYCFVSVRQLWVYLSEAAWLEEMG